MTNYLFETIETNTQFLGQRVPFYIRFRSDAYEFAGAPPAEAVMKNAGFRLRYTLDNGCV